MASNQSLSCPSHNNGTLYDNELSASSSEKPQTTKDMWYEDLAPMLLEMLQGADYAATVIKSHMVFFREKICTTLGPHPSISCVNQVFRSYMNDDHTPIELSWAWNTGSVYPKVRYSVEPIGDTNTDVYNSMAPEALIKTLMNDGADIDLTLYEHFNSALAPTEEYTAMARYSPDTSTKFIAIEVADSGILSTKAYFMSMHHGHSSIVNIIRAVTAYPHANDNLLKALNNVFQSLSAHMADLNLQVPMLAVDCIDPSKARIKIYIRTPYTDFKSVVMMAEIGGAKLTTAQHSSLRGLWYAVLSLDGAVGDGAALPPTSHRTGGIIYHFDLQLSRPAPKVKIYIPVKHYGKNDGAVARGLSQWLEEHGMGVKGFSHYVDAVKEMCKHRDLDEGLGFHTYISATAEGDGIAVTAYLQPEMYHAKRGVKA